MVQGKGEVVLVIGNSISMFFSVHSSTLSLHLRSLSYSPVSYTWLPAVFSLLTDPYSIKYPDDTCHSSPLP